MRVGDMVTYGNSCVGEVINIKDGILQVEFMSFDIGYFYSDGSLIGGHTKYGYTGFYLEKVY